jgi:hypothetical protein
MMLSPPQCTQILSGSMRAKSGKSGCLANVLGQKWVSGKCSRAKSGRLAKAPTLVRNETDNPRAYLGKSARTQRERPPDEIYASEHKKKFKHQTLPG